MTASDAAWKPDPSGRHQYRYWDGSAWTDQVSDDGAISTDPMDSAAAGPTASTGPAGFAAASAPPPGATGAPGGGASSKTPLIIGGLVLVVLLGVAAFFLTRDDDVDQGELSEAFQAQGIDEEAADCLAGELADEFSESRAEELSEGGEMTEAETAAVFSAISECGGFGDLDLDPDDIASEEGETYGDNPTLDALWDACEGGDGQACDDLYFQSPLGSEYEEFGDTCGGRFEAGEVLCSMEELD
ncbi:DUF2510 domain-containing protein [Actinomarinicola tropica]|uniref:DUF2510 domain-containing protein n=1 Tax=Actinomarinicola tropica TaxID=2789776 RepID=UPI001E2BCE7C|nr:DUF2510 domain-containing protein [Actinomarinicola tropica]